jgi:two-component system, cell cycle sensor histidine kinase and response regulator CckA
MPAPVTKVLVVDDDPDLAVQIRQMLRQSHWLYAVEAEYGTEQLSERLSRREFDVWILDHHLAGMPGSEVLKRLPPDDERPPFVVLTMSPDPLLSQVYLALGAADFLNKDELRPALLERTLRYVIAQDSDRRNLERQQQQLLRFERMATIGRIAAGVAHEYNNLNAVILVALERIQRRMPADPETNRLLLHVIDSIHGSRRISDSLLRISRPGDPDGEVIDLGVHVQEMVQLLRTQAEKSGIDLNLIAGGGTWWVKLDAGDLQQVLSNLIVNSIHAVHARPNPRIQVELREDDGWAMLSVTDNGVGISAEDLARIFQPFFSRKGAHDKLGLFPKDAPGTGLGLALCQTLIENAGGTLGITSNSGMGTVVVVKLPLVPAMELPVPSQPLGICDRQGQPPLRVVVVDDNEQFCELFAEECRLHGVEAQTFPSPLDFLAQFADLRFDVLVLDWQMPGLSGWDVVERLGDPMRPVPIPVFIISGENPSLPQTLPEGVEIRQILTKPFLVRDLIASMRQVPGRAER